MADWTKPNSPDFRSGGDLTSEVLAKMIPNETDIYTKLTALRNRQRSATPPANPNVGDVWECSTTGGSYTADVVYRYNGSAWAEASSPAIASTARNVVLQGAVTTAGATALFTGSTAALTVQLNATDTPVVFSFMNGNSESTGEINIIDSISADNASFWTGLPQSSTVYLYANYSGGTITGGFTTVAPVYQSYAPSHASGKHWIDDNKGQVWSSNGSTWTQVYRVFVGTATTDTTKVMAVSIYPYNVLRKNITGLASLNEPALGNPVANDYVLKSSTTGVREWVAQSSGLSAASSEQAIAGTSDTVAITPLQLRNGLNASGSAPIYACRAWVNFNGTGTIAIRASGNVSSITDNGTGDYTVNFTNDFVDVNYSASCMAGGTTSLGYSRLNDAGNQTVSYFRAIVVNYNGGSLADAAVINVNVFR